MIASKKMKGCVSDAIGVTNDYRTINDIMNDWMDKHMALNIVNDENGALNRDKNG